MSLRTSSSFLGLFSTLSVDYDTFLANEQTVVKTTTFVILNTAAISVAASMTDTDRLTSLEMH